MPRRRLAPLLALLLVGASTAGAAAQSPGYAPDTPQARTLYENGPSGRYLMAGSWLFRADPRGQGVSAAWQRQTSTTGWSLTTVPNAWNATDESEASMRGGIGWYRKDFRLPSSRKSLSWVIRFESVNYRSRIWLNGRRIGTNTGAYLPFELIVPAKALRRGATNRLVIRVDSRRKRSDFPPAGDSVAGSAIGGWWNYGGILREVYLRRVDGTDFSSVQVRPVLPCSTCPATMRFRALVRNAGSRARPIHVTATFGGAPVNLGTRTVRAGRTAEFTGSVRVAHPKLWSPDSPTLYPVTLTAGAAHYSLRTGIRSIRVSGGRLLLNGRKLNFRGVGLHEDSKQFGFAINNTIRDQFISWTRELGATLIRSHYPLHPYLEEQADKLGIMLWSEIPVYSVHTKYLRLHSVRRLAAQQLRNNILTNSNHPSIVVWSIQNELSSRTGPAQTTLIRDQVALAHSLDPARPVGLAVAAYPSAGCQAGYAPLDVVGVNDYFGWYPGPSGTLADEDGLSPYLDAVRACYPQKALIVTETGAEANREGPEEEKGTYAFQSDFANFHFNMYATKPYLSGAIWWGLQEFRVRPSWNGGNPRPNPPVHAKGLITQDGVRKPAFFELQRIFKATQQLGSSKR
jgi:beta-galactosidase/beta-glucuronidase